MLTDHRRPLKLELIPLTSAKRLIGGLPRLGDPKVPKLCQPHRLQLCNACRTKASRLLERYTHLR